MFLPKEEHAQGKNNKKDLLHSVTLELSNLTVPPNISLHVIKGEVQDIRPWTLFFICFYLNEWCFFFFNLQLLLFESKGSTNIFKKQNPQQFFLTYNKIIDIQSLWLQSNCQN